MVNTKLPQLDKLRYVIKDESAIKDTKNGMLSLTNSFSRYYEFLSQKLEDINTQNLAKRREQAMLLKQQQMANKNGSFEEDRESPDLAKQKSQSHTGDIDSKKGQDQQQNEGNLLDDIDNEDINTRPNMQNIEIERQSEDVEAEGEEDEDESMSLKDVIMTLNEFYSYKLDGVLSLIDTCVLQSAKADFESQISAIEQVVKDNEVKIPYDEDIFLGIDKNYKILKKVFDRIKSEYTPKSEKPDQSEIISQKDAEIESLKKQLEELKGAQDVKEES